MNWYKHAIEEIRNTVNPYNLFMMDLSSEIASIEETIESYKEELQNPNLSLRSRSLPTNESQYRRKIKLILTGQIKRLNALKAQLKREQRKKEVHPEFVNSYQDNGPFRNPQ